MKYNLLLAVLCLTLITFGRNTDTIPPVAKRIAPDTTRLIPDTSFNLYQYKEDSAVQAKRMQNNIDGIVRLQNENRSKQKKAARTRIIFGAAMLVVLVIGLVRKKRIKN